MLVLIIGDLHIPQRAVDIPLELKKLLVPGKVDKIICTGNLTSEETFEYLKIVSADVVAVKGDYDQADFPESISFELCNFTVSVINGHQIIAHNDKTALERYMNTLSCDVLITGHSHMHHAFQENKKIYLNPGSATGSVGQFGEAIPSFLLLDVVDLSMTCYVYTLKNGKVDVEKLQFNKRA